MLQKKTLLVSFISPTNCIDLLYVNISLKSRNMNILMSLQGKMRSCSINCGILPYTELLLLALIMRIIGLS